MLTPAQRQDRFETLFPKVWEAAYRSAYALFPEKAEDCAQFAMLQLWTSEALETHPEPFARTCARNYALDLLKMDRRRPTVEVGDPPYSGQSPADATLEGELKTHLYECISRLEEELRNVVSLVTFGGMTFDDVARVLGISRTVAHGRYKRAKVRLSDCLRSKGIESPFGPAAEKPGTPVVIRGVHRGC
jgi:RNA polymerase sigma factor (sigma-70 family)